MSGNGSIQTILAVADEANARFDRKLRADQHAPPGGDTLSAYLEEMQVMQDLQVVHVATGLALEVRNHSAREVLKDMN